MKNEELTRVLGALRPAVTSELADAAYERRPDPALIRARAAGGPPVTAVVPRRRTGRRLAVATAVAAAVTATAVAASTLTGGPPSRDHGTARTGGTGPGGVIDARTFLLTSADTAARQPVTHGTCWYSRTRMAQDMTMGAPKGPHRPGAPIPRRPATGPAYRVRTSSGAEDWKCTRPGTTLMRFRTRLPLDIRVTFPTRKDEAAWHAAGSPPLDINGGTTATRPQTVTYEHGSHLVNPDIGSHEIEWKDVPRLPATKDGLEKYLRALWRQDRRNSAFDRTTADFGTYVFVSAWDLFMAPTTPGTRAALYRILADTPTIRVIGRYTDREGRTGVAITDRNTHVFLVVDQATAQLLDYEQAAGDDPGAWGAPEYYSFERQGWVNRIGVRP